MVNNGQADVSSRRVAEERTRDGGGGDDMDVDDEGEEAGEAVRGGEATLVARGDVDMSSPQKPALAASSQLSGLQAMLGVGGGAGHAGGAGGVGGGGETGGDPGHGGGGRGAGAGGRRGAASDSEEADFASLIAAKAAAKLLPDGAGYDILGEDDSSSEEGESEADNDDDSDE